MNKLEEFRLLITYIGNCIAFVRILRTASLNYLSKNMEFVPYAEEIQCSFGDTCKVLEFKSATFNDCCKDLDGLIQMLRDKFSDSDEKKEESDYLRVRDWLARPLLNDTRGSSRRTSSRICSTFTC